MLVTFAELLADAERRGAAVGAFTAYNLETATAVLRAAEERATGVMLLLSRDALRSPAGGRGLLAGLRAAADRAPAPCCVQLDHVADRGLMEAALAEGAGAVMADGSRLPLAENVALVREAAALAAQRGAGVEAELGHVAGDEEVAAVAQRGALTDPGQAAAFVAAAGATCLAVSIGNVHGRYTREPELDWARLAALRERVPVPLSLHGASGLPDAGLAQAIAGGIRKVNVNTELRDRWFAVLAERAAPLGDGARLLALQEELVDALAKVVAAKLAVLAG